MPTDKRLRLHDPQGVHNAWRNPVEAGKNQTVNIAENKPLWGFSPQHIELVDLQLYASRIEFTVWTGLHQQDDAHTGSSAAG
jgi:hypothetical protein